MKQGKSAGLSENDVQTLALTQGFSMDQIENYREEQGKQDLINSRERVIESVVPAAPVESPIENFPIFGLDFFKKAQNGFQPNPNQATPSNYRLGAGDELYVDIYGASEKYYNATISPDGYLTLSNIGPIYLQGKDIEEAEKIITNRLSKMYAGVSGPNPNTFVQVGIGQVRTIQVHLVGEVSSPGTYQVSGLGNVFNALYAAGGPNENGSFRAIKVFRSNKLIGTMDIYQFLIFGKFSSNLRLEDNDVILVPPYLSRVLVKGEVKKPAYFEVLEGQTFLDLLTYAGSFTDEAYEERVELIRKTDKELLVSEVFASQFSFFPVKGGDQYSVGKVLTRYTNRIAISGAVFRPGNYGYTEGITLTQLIDRAEGLRGDAHTERVLINRTAPDLSTSTVSINLSEVREGILDDIELQPEDEIIIQSYYDQLQKPFVKISGEVLNAGTFPYKEQITLGDLLFEAKGMKISADQGQVEISRRLSQQTPLSQREVLAIDMNDPDALNFELNAYDHVMIRRNTDYFEEATISVVGEISAPGIYSLLSREERVSDVLLRAGGLSTWAYPEGATLIRKSEYFEAENEWVNKIIELRAIQNKLDTVYSEAGQILNQKINEEITQYEQQLQLNDRNLASTAKQERLAEIKRRNPFLSNIDIKRNETIALDIRGIVQKPGGKSDLRVESGDILIIPRKIETVRLRGQVLYPTTVQHVGNLSARSYVNQAGGFDKLAMRKNTYVIYANGEVARTRNFLFFHSYPEVQPGAEVIVPVRPIKIPLRAGELISISSSVTALVAVVVTTINQLNP